MERTVGAFETGS